MDILSTCAFEGWMGALCGCGFKDWWVVFCGSGGFSLCGNVRRSSGGCSIGWNLSLKLWGFFLFLFLFFFLCVFVWISVFR